VCKALKWVGGYVADWPALWYTENVKENREVPQRLFLDRATGPGINRGSGGGARVVASKMGRGICAYRERDYSGNRTATHQPRSIKIYRGGIFSYYYSLLFAHGPLCGGVCRMPRK